MHVLYPCAASAMVLGIAVPVQGSLQLINLPLLSALKSQTQEKAHSRSPAQGAVCNFALLFAW